MTSGKAALLTASLVGVVALGVVTAPTIRNHWSKMDTPATTASAPADTSATAPAKATKRPAHRTTTSRDAMTAKKETGKVDIVAVSVWQPELRDRVKKVLNPGARLELAAEDFTSAEQFVTVAHAARNTQVPFAVLKDRVLNQGKSLADAIHEFKPELDARAEVMRARTEARSDLEITS
jgi:hypothetical protein